MNHPADPLNDPRFGDVMSRLRAQPRPEPTDGFSLRVQNRIHDGGKIHKKLSRSVIRIAACLLFLLSASILLVPRNPSSTAVSPSPVDVLMAAQRVDGGWSADSRNLRSRYDTGVTALVLLALIHDDSEDMTEEKRAAIRSGASHLWHQQTPDGRFGPDFSGWRFNQYLATKAMEAAAGLAGADPTWHAAVERAQWHLPCEFQMAKLNQHLSHPEEFPSRWMEAGGPVAVTAIRMLKR